MREPIVILQARMRSRRLPGKVLLDFHGLPVAILAAKRAATRGLGVVLATSVDRSDDALFRSAAQHGLDCIRGSIDDVLSRFLIALGERENEAIVVRLTADNVLPDGDLIDDVVDDFKRRDLDYVTTTDAASGLPHGCAVEVTRAGHLRSAASHAKTAFEREHVTPWIRERFGVSVCTRHAELKRGHFRATIDCLDDFETMHRAFPTSTDPIKLGWRELIGRLTPGDGQPRTNKPLNDFVLGTAQLGMTYGIARLNSPDSSEAQQMIKTAISNGAAWIDTARAYGSSEQLIGRVLSRGWEGRCRVVTKLSPLGACDADTPISTVRCRADASLLESCIALQQQHLDTVLLHRGAHLAAWQGSVLDVLRCWRDGGRLRAIGVSVQSPEELDHALEFDDVTHIQLPCNLLDHRWDRIVARIESVRLRRTLVVHVRSALLQGLLTTDAPGAWKRAHVPDPRPILEWMQRSAQALGQPDVVSLCVSWARGLTWADGVVVGCDSVDQLNSTIAAFDHSPLATQQMVELAADRPEVPTRTLDPAQWHAEQEAVS
jgi:spore coat polysaccharide biosynthesis protein SpsF (cytidylyltransferase family)/aryl-alcohol dehydrogenase-like predicted oxidoreductase